MRNNWFFTLDDFGALEYVTKFSWWELMWRGVTVGDPWRFNKFLGYWVFKLFVILFGIKVGWWMIGIFLVNLVNLLLLFGIVVKLTNSRLWGLVAALILDKFYLGWFSNLHELTGGFWVLVGIWGWMNLISVEKGKWFVVSVVSYVFAIMSKEMTVTMPVFWGVLAVAMNKKKKMRKNLFKVFWPALFVVWAYVVRGQYLVDRKEDFVYLMKFSGRTFWQSLKFYSGNLFGGLGIYGWIVLGGLGLRNKKLLLILIAFFAGIFPAMWFPNRQEQYYLYVPVIYLAVYVALAGNSLGRQSQIPVAILIIVLFGGKNILPKWSKEVYVNHQKNEVLEIVDEVKFQVNRATKFPIVIELGKFEIGRDAGLLLDSGTLDLFADNGHFYKRLSFNKVEVGGKK